jgi:hypothetical protein
MQNGTPTLAREYVPATIDQAAMPIRIEKWQVDGKTLYNVVGVMWGGSRPTDALSIRFNADLPFDRVAVCTPPATLTTWSFWSYAWRPAAPGMYEIRLRADDASIRQRRLAAGFYARKVVIADV